MIANETEASVSTSCAMYTTRRSAGKKTLPRFALSIFLGFFASLPREDCKAFLPFSIYRTVVPSITLRIWQVCLRLSGAALGRPKADG